MSLFPSVADSSIQSHSCRLGPFHSRIYSGSMWEMTGPLGSLAGGSIESAGMLW